MGITFSAGVCFGATQLELCTISCFCGCPAIEVNRRGHREVYYCADWNCRICCHFGCKFFRGESSTGILFGPCTPKSSGNMTLGLFVDISSASYSALHILFPMSSCAHKGFVWWPVTTAKSNKCVFSLAVQYCGCCYRRWIVPLHLMKMVCEPSSFLITRTRDTHKKQDTSAPRCWVHHASAKVPIAQAAAGKGQGGSQSKRCAAGCTAKTTIFQPSAVVPRLSHGANQLSFYVQARSYKYRPSRSAIQNSQSRLLHSPVVSVGLS